jgi:hypothetical protein
LHWLLLDTEYTRSVHSIVRLGGRSLVQEVALLTDAARTALLGLVQSACEVVLPSRFSPNRSRRGFALYDTERDKSITEVAEFAGAAAALQADPDIAAIYGAENARRLAIQFVYNTCGLVDDGLDVQAAFDAT